MMVSYFLQKIGKARYLTGFLYQLCQSGKTLFRYLKEHWVGMG